MEKIRIENFISPGSSMNVDAAKYGAVRAAYLAVLPGRSPGLTPAEIREKIVPMLPQDLFPGGAKAGWWAKAVQLDLEAKGIVMRAATKPVRLHRVSV
jgi:hypothetical protein